MFSGFMHASQDSQVSVPDDGRRPQAAAPGPDWRAVRRAGRSCCCPALPRVVAIMPPAAGRPVPADLLLCWHHYRASRQALAAAGARILGTDGAPVTDQDWPPATAAEDPGAGTKSP